LRLTLQYRRQVAAPCEKRVSRFDAAAQLDIFGGAKAS
jgi:hypothetical protein